MMTHIDFTAHQVVLLELNPYTSALHVKERMWWVCLTVSVVIRSYVLITNGYVIEVFCIHKLMCINSGVLNYFWRFNIYVLNNNLFLLIYLVDLTVIEPKPVAKLCKPWYHNIEQFPQMRLSKYKYKNNWLVQGCSRLWTYNLVSSYIGLCFCLTQTPTIAQGH